MPGFIGAYNTTVFSSATPTGARDSAQLRYVLSYLLGGRQHPITETGLGLLQVAALPIDLIEYKEERLAGSKDLLHGHKVLAGSVALMEHAKV